MPITKSKVTFTYDLSDKLEGVNRRKAAKIKQAVGQLLISEIDNYTEVQKSPVKNQRAFKELSDKYKAIKKSKGKGDKANLKLNFEMLDAWKINNKPQGVELAITDRKEKKKAENHNHGVTVPKRQFLPDDVKSQDFKEDIKKKVNNLVEGML